MLWESFFDGKYRIDKCLDIMLNFAQFETMIFYDWIWYKQIWLKIQ